MSLTDLLRYILGAFCHQLPAHSLRAYGVALPLCARCTGMHLAASATLLCLHLQRATRGRAGFPTGSAAWALGILAALWLVDGLNSTTALVWGHALYPPQNALRLATGIGLGVGLGMLLYPLLQDALVIAPVAQPVADGWRDLAPPLVGGIAAVALTLLAPWETARDLLLAGAALATLTISNGLGVVALLRSLRDRRVAARRWLAPLGLLAASAEIALLLLARARLVI